MTEATDFARYELKLLKKRFRMTSVIVWDKDVYLGEWTEYDGEALRRKYGSKWRGQVAEVVSLDHFELRGLEGEAGEVGTVLSSWWERENRLAEKIAAARERGAPVDRERGLRMIVDQMLADRAAARGRKPSRADGAAHLLDCEGRVPKDAVWVMNEVGWKDVDEVNLPRHARHGRKRRAEGKDCRFTKMS